MTQLFDLYLHHDGAPPSFQMRAPLPVLVQVLQFGDRAMERIEYETKDNQWFCQLHKNGHVWLVQRAYLSLGADGAQVQS
jgi:hypothetical protein